MTLTLYTKPGCIYCDKAKSYLTNFSIPFTEVDITTDPGARAFLLSQGFKSVPVAYQFSSNHRPELVGGHQEIMGLSHG